eukprot:COSAG02_NODE_3720_length_6323_cov_7.586600_2_plen_246_part_00
MHVWQKCVAASTGNIGAGPDDGGVHFMPQLDMDPAANSNSAHISIFGADVISDEISALPTQDPTLIPSQDDSSTAFEWNIQARRKDMSGSNTACTASRRIEFSLKSEGGGMGYLGYTPGSRCTYDTCTGAPLWVAHQYGGASLPLPSADQATPSFDAGVGGGPSTSLMMNKTSNTCKLASRTATTVYDRHHHGADYVSNANSTARSTHRPRPPSVTLSAAVAYFGTVPFLILSHPLSHFQLHSRS